MHKVVLSNNAFNSSCAAFLIVKNFSTTIVFNYFGNYYVTYLRTYEIGNS